jgi:ketosteroid isomerase-like protein
MGRGANRIAGKKQEKPKDFHGSSRRGLYLLGAFAEAHTGEAMRQAAVRFILLTLAVAAAPLAAASPQDDDEVRQTFDRFVAAQNAHDIKAVEGLLLDSADFLWITRGTPVWGREAALKRFEALYKGTWHLAPEAGALKVVPLGEGAAQLFVPIAFSIGAPGQAAQTTRFLMNQVLVKTPAGWKVYAILPIPASAP